MVPSLLGSRAEQIRLSIGRAQHSAGHRAGVPMNVLCSDRRHRRHQGSLVLLTRLQIHGRLCQRAQRQTLFFTQHTSFSVSFFPLSRMFWHTLAKRLVGRETRKAFCVCISPTRKSMYSQKQPGPGKGPVRGKCLRL